MLSTRRLSGPKYDGSGQQCTGVFDWSIINLGLDLRDSDVARMVLESGVERD